MDPIRVDISDERAFLGRAGFVLAVWAFGCSALLLFTDADVWASCAPDLEQFCQGLSGYIERALGLEEAYWLYAAMFFAFGVVCTIFSLRIVLENRNRIGRLQAREAKGLKRSDDA